MQTTTRGGKAVKARKHGIKAPVACAVAVACTLLAHSARAESPFASMVPRTEGGPAHELGAGFDSRNQRFTKPCVTGNLAYDRATIRGEVRLDNFVSESKLTELLKGSLTAGVDLVFARAEATISFAGMNTDKAYARSLTYASDMQGATAIVASDFALTAYGKEAAATMDPVRIRQMCGDEWVVGVDLGVQLFLSTRVDFRAEAQRKEFDIAVKLSAFGFSKTEHFTELSEDLKKSSFISIDGMQLGGDPSRLAALLTAGRKRQCGLEKISECSAIMNDLMQYATAEDGMKAQYGGDLSYRGAASPVRMYLTQRYADGPFAASFDPHPDPITVAAVRGAIAELEYAYLGEQQDLTRAEQLLAGNLRPEQRVDLNDYVDKARLNTGRLSHAFEMCYARPGECLQRRSDVFAALIHLDRARLFRPTTTYDYCRLTARQAEDDKVIAALERSLGITTGDRSDAACRTFEEKLDQASTLDLDSAGITELRALRGIRGLKRLSLRSNKVVNLNPLVKFTGIEQLDITNNLVRSLGSLSPMTGLKRIDAGFNEIPATDGLEGLASLEWIALHGNKVTDYTQVQNLPNLKHLFRTVDERCAAEREFVRVNNLADSATVDGFAARKFGPIYLQPKNRTAGIDGWARCEYATRNY